MDVRKIMPLTYIKSIHSSRESRFSYSSGGIAMRSSTMGRALRRVVLPLRVPRSAPKIFSARSISAVLTGKSEMAFMAIIALRSAILGVPRAARRSRAALARLTSLGVWNFMFSSTDCTNTVGSCLWFLEGVLEGFGLELKL